MPKKYLDSSGLQYFFNKIKTIFATSEHEHTKSEISDLELPLPVSEGGTGAATDTLARTNLSVPGLETTNTFTQNQLISSSAAKNIKIKDTSVDLTASNNGVSSNHGPLVGFTDKNDVYSGFVQNLAYTDGSVGLSMGSRNKGTGSEVTNSINLKVANDGTLTVGLSSVAAWVATLKSGLLARKPASTTDLPQAASTTTGFPIVLDNSFANGGNISYMTVANFRKLLGFDTWTSVTVANYITFTSGAGWSNVSTNIRYNAALGIVRVYANWKTSSAKTGNITIGTVASTYRPKTITISIPSLTSNAYNGYVDTSGIFRCNCGSNGIAANGTVYFVGDYVIGV